MKEKIYTIPVTEAFEEDSECPFCSLYHKLESDAIQYTMGPSYMENEVRDETNERGFCQNHVQKLYKEKNRLGLALMLSTHQTHVKKKLEALIEKDQPVAKGLFKKKENTPSSVKAYIDKVKDDCYICHRINHFMERYINTFFYIWKKEPTFRTKVEQCKGFCSEHFGLLYDLSSKELKGTELDNFILLIKDLYLKNVNRVQEDLDWFINKFDYRYQNEPWKNAKDALPRTIIKTNSTKIES